MNTKIISIIVVLAAILGGIYLFKTAPAPVPPSDKMAVRSTVEQFGKKLQNVSLLNESGVKEAMQQQYAEYVTPALLADWQSDPSTAPGRLTSSPWPDRIEISNIQKNSDTEYEVRGSIVEVTNEGGGIDEQPTEAARRPVSLTVNKSGDEWLISRMILSAYAGGGKWVLSSTTSQGIQFMYPEVLPTKYISAQQPWPPRVEWVVNEFSCTEGPLTAADGPLITIERHTVGDRVYCVAISSGAAAGSRYNTYEYTTELGDSVARIVFTLQFPQCANYDEPNQSACEAEQATFDIDGLADRIASSIRQS